MVQSAIIALIKLILGQIDDDTVKAILDRFYRGFLRYLDVAYTALVTWVLSLLHGGQDNWLQATGEPTVDAALTPGMIFMLITAARHVVVPIILAWFRDR